VIFLKKMEEVVSCRTKLAMHMHFIDICWMASLASPMMRLFWPTDLDFGRI